MAVKGYVLINVQTGTEHSVQGVLSGIQSISEAYAMHEDYDFLIVIKGEDSTSLEKFIESNIQPIPGVIGTKMILALSVTPLN